MRMVGGLDDPFTLKREIDKLYYTRIKKKEKGVLIEEIKQRI